MDNRRHQHKYMGVVGWMGDMATPRALLLERPWLSPIWGPLKLVNSVLRSLGVVAFANNPLTGALILAGMCLGAPLIAAAALLTATTAVITSKLLRADDEAVCDGVSVFNSVLVGCISTAVLPQLLHTSLASVYHWLALCAASVVTCYVDQGLNTLMAPCGLPAQSMPFNLVVAVVFLSVRANLHGFQLESIQPQSIQPHSFQPLHNNIGALDLPLLYHLENNGSDVFLTKRSDTDVTGNAGEELTLKILGEFDSNTANITNQNYAWTTDNTTQQTETDWFKVWLGTVVAFGQVYGVGTIDSSLLIWLGMLLYSPIIAFFCYAGSTIGCAVGAVLAGGAAGQLEAVYAGLWGYNALLAAGGLAYFLQPSPHAAVAALIGALIAVFTQAAVTPLFLPTQVPVLSYPFNIAITLVLAISIREGSALSFVHKRSFPEKHLYNYYKAVQKEDVQGEDVERRLRNDNEINYRI